MRRILGLGLMLSIGGAGRSVAQEPAGHEGTPNMHVVAHIPMGSRVRTGDVEIEQELSRPYAYINTRKDVSGFDIINLKDPAKAYIMYQWRIANPELHLGGGGMDIEYFKSRGHYYVVNAMQFFQGGPDPTLAAVIVDVTGLPDTSKVKEVRRIVVPDAPGGFHDVFPYKHSDGRALLFATSGGGGRIYDLDKVIAGDPDQGYVGFVPVPAPGAAKSMSSSGAAALRTSYHDFYVGYDPVNHRDVFYGPGTGGYYIFDVTHPEEPKLITSITGVAGISGAAGIDNGHTFTPDPTGRYAVAETEYQYAPLRIFDLKPGLDGTVSTISRPIGAWATNNWRHLPHNTEVRWPYVFVSAYEDGVYVFNMMDPTNPYTVGYYNVFNMPQNMGKENEVYVRAPGVPSTSSPAINWAVIAGTWGIDVRNSDGLIVASDEQTGFWALRMDGFSGWNGHDWGMPNISSAQDWDNGPDGAPKRVS